MGEGKYEDQLQERLKKVSKDLTKSFAETLIIESKAYYQAQGKSVNKFKQSDLIKTLKVVAESGAVNVYAKDYIEYLDKGRKPMTKRVPIQAIIKWMKKMGISQANGVAFRIQASIYKKGIRPRNFIKPAMGKLEKEIGKVADQVFNTITDKL